MPIRLLPCIVCGKVHESSDSGYKGPKPSFQQHDATVFSTVGNYGSTFWDSFDNEHCVIVVCDECLRAHPERIAFTRRRNGVGRWEEFTPPGQ